MTADPKSTVRVRLFAALREAAGCAELEVSAPDLPALLDELGERFGAEFSRVLSCATVLVDGLAVGRHEPRALDAVGEVALLPPSSGGSGTVEPGG